MFTRLNKSYVLIATLSTLSLASQPATSETQSQLKLSEADIVRITQTQSLNYQDILNKKLSGNYALELANSNYRLNLNFDYSLENDSTDSFSTYLPIDSDKTKKTLTLGKRFYTGTLASLEYTNISFDAPSTTYSQNYYTLGVEQNIFPAIFSNSEKQLLTAAKLDSERIELQTDSDLLDATKEVLTLYWKTQASLKSVQESEALLKKYSRLVTNVKNKKKNSYASAGEVEQTLAEYETRKQTWAEDRQILQANIQLLKSALNIPDGQQLILDTPSYQVKPLPAQFNGDIKTLRKYKLQKLKTESALANYESVSFKNYPKVSAYGKYTSQGLDSSEAESTSEMLKNSKDKYVIGLKLDYFFGDDLTKSEQQLRRATKDLEEARFARLETDLKEQVASTRVKLENAYANVTTTQNVVKYRTEVVKQLNITYLQGRTDISFLIDAFNKKIQAEVAAINALGSYSTTLIEYQNLVF